MAIFLCCWASSLSMATASENITIWQQYDKDGKKHGLVIELGLYYRGFLLQQSQYEHGILEYEVITSLYNFSILSEITQLKDHPKHYQLIKQSGDHPYLSEYFYFAEDGSKVLHGPQVIWTNYVNQENTIKTLKDYAHGKLHGRSYEFSSEGDYVTKEEHYQNGLEAGVWIQRYDQNKINTKAIWFQDGKFVIRYSYLDDGRIYEIPMFNGLRHGDFRILDRDDKLLKTMPYIHGKQEGLTHGVTNGERYEQNYKNDQRQGEHKRWYANGVLKSLEIYDEGWNVGMHQFWDVDGNLREENEYKEKNKRSRLTKWWANGNKQKDYIFEDHYDDGRLKQGTVTEWNQTGKLQKQMIIKDGECSGVVKDYDAHGRATERKCLESEHYVW